MANISLLSSIQTCKVDTGWANKIQSARFQDPNLMMCPVWNGFNTKGQRVCPDSFMTKRAGCNTPMDRVAVENALRPQYAEYINLDAQGFQSNGMYADNMNWTNAGHQQASVDNIQANNPNFGLQFGHSTYQRCPAQYSQAMSQMGYNDRNAQQLQEGFQANQMRRASGM
jgi:hypothetical protein